MGYNVKDKQCIINTHRTVKEAYNLVKGVTLPYFGAKYKDNRVYGAHIKTTDKDALVKKTMAFKDSILVIDQYSEEF